MTRLLTIVSLGLALAGTPALAGPHGGGGGGGGGGFRGGGRPGGGYGGRGGGYGRGPYGRPGGYYHHGSHVFIGGSFFVDPFFWPSYPYYAPYPYYYGSYYGYPSAPPPYDGGDYASGAPDDDDSDAEAPPPNQNVPDQDAKQETPDEADRANYGLIQLKGLPNGTAIDLDGRFWLKALNLDKRWLAVPHGKHTITAYVSGGEPSERRVDIGAGKNQVVKFGPYPHG